MATVHEKAKAMSGHTDHRVGIYRIAVSSVMTVMNFMAMRMGTD